MENQLLAEILAVHANELNEERQRKEAYLSLFPAYRDKLEPLLSLAERIKGVLTPQKPSAAFRRHLGQGLMAAARQTVAQGARRPVRSLRPVILWGAAALGSALSLAGLVALFLRFRLGERFHLFPWS
ncbi:MAG: hypothetical protein ACE5MB_01160 [Anaerolineae bacterium]